MTAMAAVALTAVAASPAGAQDATLTVLHALPGTDVELWANGEVLIPDFELGDREDISFLSGETLIDLEVREADSGAVIIRSETGVTELPGSGTFTIVAHLDGAGQPKLAVFRHDDSVVPAGEGRLTVRHVADTPTLQIFLNNEPFGDGLDNASQATKPLTEGPYELLFLDETGDLFIDPMTISIQEGESLIVYAVGSAEDTPLTIEQGRFIENEQPVADEPEPDPEPAVEEDDPADGGFVMAESETNNSAPAAVDTGLGPLAITRVSWPRTLLLAAVALLGVSGLTAALRRRSTSG